GGRKPRGLLEPADRLGGLGSEEAVQGAVVEAQILQPALEPLDVGMGLSRTAQLEEDRFPTDGPLGAVGGALVFSPAAAHGEEQPEKPNEGQAAPRPPAARPAWVHRPPPTSLWVPPP